MKRLIPLLFLVTVCNSYSQSNNTSNLDITLHQDTRLLFFGDKRGNSRGTIDILIKAEVPIIRHTKGYVVLYPSFEYAGLVGGDLRRYSAGAGYIFENVFIKNINFGLFLDYGVINRKGNTTGSGGFNTELSYRIFKNYSFSYIHQIVDRTDIDKIDNSANHKRASSFVGMKFSF